MVTWDTEDNTVMEELKINLGEYLEQIRNSLLSHKLDYAEELGLFAT